MTTYYVNASTGSDSNNGTSAATPWQTVTKALASGSGPTGGDTIYIAPGTYREQVSAALTSPVSTLNIIGDVTGQYTNTVGGEVRITNFTSGDNAAPGTGNTLTITDVSFLKFQNICFIHGHTGALCVNITTAGTIGAHDITFVNCSFYAQYRFVLSYTGVANVAANLTVDSCQFFSGTGNNSMNITLPTSATADYNANILIKNSFGLTVGSFVQVTPSGANSFKGGGVTILNCSALCNIFYTGNNVNLSSTYQTLIYNCYVFGMTGSNLLNANNTGQVVEDYNALIGGGGARNNVTAGANSVATTATIGMMAPNFGQAQVYGGFIRPFMTPISGSNAANIGSTGAIAAPTTDLTGKGRPAGMGSIKNTVGAFERHDTGAKETSTVRTGSNALNITGPGDHEFRVPVDATATTLSVYARYDTNHGSTNKPQMIVTNGGECGVSDATATMTAAVDTWEQLSLSFTPTSKGYVTVRLTSRAAAGTGKAFFDDFSGGATGTQGFDYFRRNEPIGTLVAGGSGGGGTTVVYTNAGGLGRL